MTLDSDGVVCFDAAKTTRYAWRAFSDVTEQAGLIVLWRDRGQGLVVPARALADEAARRAFVMLICERLAQPNITKNLVHNTNLTGQGSGPHPTACHKCAILNTVSPSCGLIGDIDPPAIPTRQTLIR